MIQWASGVNKNVQRNGTSWSDVTGFISDKTRSGKAKRRLSASMDKRTFSVKFIFSQTEYELFRAWYENDCMRGLVSFAFPQIDVANGGDVEYEFTDKGAPKYSNIGGVYYEVTMEWEEK